MSVQFGSMARLTFLVILLISGASSAQTAVVLWLDSTGVVKFGHFAAAPRPARDLDPEAIAFHERASAAAWEILFKDAEHVRPTL